MAEPVAYAIGLKPHEFEEMQPGEFLVMLEAVNRQRREEDFRTAYFLSYLIAPYVKEGASIDIEDIVAPLWGKAEEVKQRKALERQQKKEADRKVLETEFAWALGSE